MAKLLEYLVYAESVDTPMGVIHTHGFAVFEAIPAYKMAALGTGDDAEFDAEYDQRFEEAKL